jgi:hypothetical protein
MSRYPGDCQKTFQVELIDRNWKKKSIEAQADNHQILWDQNIYNGKE